MRVGWHIQSAKGKLLIFYPINLSFRNEREIKTCLDQKKKKKLRESNITMPTSLALLKGVLQPKPSAIINSELYSKYFSTIMVVCETILSLV
jgi:hypothetical protein